MRNVRQCALFSIETAYGAYNFIQWLIRWLAYLVFNLTSDLWILEDCGNQEVTDHFWIIIWIEFASPKAPSNQLLLHLIELFLILLFILSTDTKIFKNPGIIFRCSRYNCGLPFEGPKKVIGKLVCMYHGYKSSTTNHRMTNWCNDTFLLNPRPKMIQ